MKWLIVNGDDFGMSAGISRGIVEAHRTGILTSTSLMVKRPTSKEAVALSRRCPKQIGVEALVRLMDAEVGESVTELVCRPGYVEPGFSSSYAAEREVELGTLCDARVHQAIVVRGIRLIGFRDLAALVHRTSVVENPTCPRS